MESMKELNEKRCDQIKKYPMKVEVLTVAIMKITVVYYVTRCTLMGGGRRTASIFKVEN
jgi:hypothetical protein